jgi:hypothetical protein
VHIFILYLLVYGTYASSVLMLPSSPSALQSIDALLGARRRHRERLQYLKGKNVSESITKRIIRAAVVLSSAAPGQQQTHRDQAQYLPPRLDIPYHTLFRTGLTGQRKVVLALRRRNWTLK